MLPPTSYFAEIPSTASILNRTVTADFKHQGERWHIHAKNREPFLWPVEVQQLRDHRTAHTTIERAHKRRFEEKVSSTHISRACVCTGFQQQADARNISVDGCHVKWGVILVVARVNIRFCLQ